MSHITWGVTLESECARALVWALASAGTAVRITRGYARWPG